MALPLQNLSTLRITSTTSGVRLAGPWPMFFATTPVVTAVIDTFPEENTLQKLYIHFNFFHSGRNAEPFEEAKFFQLADTLSTKRFSKLKSVLVAATIPEMQHSDPVSTCERIEKKMQRELGGEGRAWSLELDIRLRPVDLRSVMDHKVMGLWEKM
jgi:hypothetical protein